MSRSSWKSLLPSTSEGTRKVLRLSILGVLEAAAVTACILVVFYYRLLNLEPIEVGGDALKIWEFARGLIYGGDLPEEFNHHTSRFGIVVPVMLVQYFWGAQATSYYIAPLLGSVALHLLVYLVARKLHGPIAGAIAVIGLLGFEPMIRPSSQVLPESFGPMFTMFAVYMALLATDRKHQRARVIALIFAALGIFWAYAAKIVYLYYAPGIAFIVWFGTIEQSEVVPANQDLPKDAGRLRRSVAWARSRGLLVPGVLTLTVLILLLIDTVLMSSISSSGGRFDVLRKTHGVLKDPRQLRIAADFFALYVRAPSEWQTALWIGCFSLLGVGAYSRDRRARLFALMLFIYFLLQTFVVRRLNPLTPWTNPHPRYLLAMAAPMAVLIGGFFAESLGRILLSVPRLQIAAIPPTWRKAMLLTLALGILTQPVAELRERWTQEWGRRDGWHQTQEQAKQFTEAFSAGLPIISTTPLGKPAWAAGAVFIDPKALMIDGKLPDHSAFKRKIGKGRYLARAVNDPDISGKRLDNVVEERRRKRNCAIVVDQRYRFMRGRLTFDPSCPSLEETFRRDPKAGKSKARRKKKKKRKKNTKE